MHHIFIFSAILSGIPFPGPQATSPGSPPPWSSQENGVSVHEGVLEKKNRIEKWRILPSLPSIQWTRIYFCHAVWSKYQYALPVIKLWHISFGITTSRACVKAWGAKQLPFCKNVLRLIKQSMSKHCLQKRSVYFKLLAIKSFKTHRQ